MPQDCILIPHPPTCFELIFSECIIFANPEKIEYIKKTQKPTTKPISIIISLPHLTNIATKLKKEYHIALPKFTTTTITDPLISIYPTETEIPISKNISAYLLYPPIISEKNKDQYYILITSKSLILSITTRPTYIEQPPHIDIVLTTKKVIDTITQYTNNINEIPNYLGFDAQWCFILSNNNKKQHQFIYTKNKSYIIKRHLTGIYIKEQ
ncbi:MAG: hypothetical protein Q6363_007490 [Candidatus Njordarchaeota archaeon]